MLCNYNAKVCTSTSVHLQLMQHFYNLYPLIWRYSFYVYVLLGLRYTVWLKHEPSVPCGSGLSRNPAVCDKCFSAGCVCRHQQAAGAHTNSHSSPYQRQFGPDAATYVMYARARYSRTSDNLHFSSTLCSHSGFGWWFWDCVLTIRNIFVHENPQSLFAIFPLCLLCFFHSLTFIVVLF